MSDYQGLYLPKQLANTNVARPSEDGLWGEKEGRVIADLAKGLDVGDTRRATSISSIPDVYARPLLFQSAFGNASHPLHQRTVQEWRGLLSLLALHRVKKGLVDLLTFTFVDYARGGDNPLVQAVQRLAPPSVQLESLPAPAYRWTELLLIQFDGVTLGALSPTTLVFTAADYNLRLRPNGEAKPHISAFLDDEGYLCPPQVGRNRDDLEAVGEWVQWLKGDPRGASGINVLFNRDINSTAYGQTSLLNKELDQWLAAMRQELNSPELNAPRYQPGDPQQYTRVPDAAFLDTHQVYQWLLTPLQLDASAASGADSECALVLAQRQSAPHRHVIVIHRGLSKSLRLWQDIKLENLGNNPFDTMFREASGYSLGGHDIGKDGGIWIRPELFFLTSTLTRASGQTNFLADGETHANGDSSRFILPLQPTILDYFTVEEITDKLKPTYKNEDNNKVTFSLQLPLSGRPPLVIEKTYLLKGANFTAGEGQLVEREVPVMEVFPTYMGEFWARYYLLFSDTEKLGAEPINRSGNAFYPGPTREQRADTSTERLRAEVTRIGGVDCFPEGIRLYERGSQETVGLVLLEKYNAHGEGDLRPEKAFDNSSATFGVDFGTSNTNVFLKRGDAAQPLALRFSKYLRPLTAATPLRKEICQAFFVPTDDRQLPTPTALRVYNPGVRENLLLDYFIYLPDRYRYPENVVVDLKWQQESRVSLDNFLESLVFLLVLEAVRQRIGKISFRCTFPKSFSSARVQEYQGKWKAALGDIFEFGDSPEPLRQGRKFLFGRQLKDNKFSALQTPRSGSFAIALGTHFATEGEAAGEFFKKDGASLETGAICIDVGGGTTDFSLLYEGISMYDASVLLAGRQVSEMLAQNDRIGTTLFSADANDALQQALAADNAGTKFASRMNFILRSEHQDISIRLAREAGNDTIRPLRRVLMVEFGALAFYAGHLALALNQFKGGRLGKSLALSGLGLHWGGNASKMLDWIDGGQFQPTGEGAAKLLNTLFGSVVTNKELTEAERLPLKPSLLSQKQSTGHKNEAAGGVVEMSTYKPAVEEEEDVFDFGDEETASAKVLEGLVMGERVTFNGRTYPAHYLFKKDEVKQLLSANRTPYEDTNLEQLDQFLKIVNYLGVRHGGLDPSEVIQLSAPQRLAIRNKVRTTYADQTTLQPDDRMLEPAFIIEVRHLLEIMRKEM